MTRPLAARDVLVLQHARLHASGHVVSRGAAPAQAVIRLERADGTMVAEVCASADLAASGHALSLRGDAEPTLGPGAYRLSLLTSADDATAVGNLDYALLTAA